MDTESRNATYNPTESVKPRPRKRRRRWPWVVGLLVILSAAGIMALRRPKPDDTKTATVVRQDIRQQVTATGSVTLQTAAEVKIGAEVSGKVKRLYVDVGDSVRAGQLIAELENPESDAILQQARASVDAASARVRQSAAALTQQRPTTAAAINSARASVRAAEARYRQSLASAGSQPGASEADINRSRADLNIARDALTQANASASLQVENAQSALDASRAQAELSESNVRRARELVAKGFISQREADQAETTHRVNLADVTSREKALALARASVRHDLDSARHRVEQAQASLAAARAGSSQVEITGEQAKAAREDLESAREALRAAIAGQGDVTVRSAQAEESRAAYQQSAAELQRQLNNFAKMRIYSPIDGIVTQVATKEGETVTAGFQTPTLMTIADLQRIQVEAPIDETDIGRVQVGQRANVTVDAFPNTAMPGRVTKVASDATVENNVVSYKCTVAIDRATLPLKPRMTAMVRIDTGLVRNALVVPLDAVKTAKDHDVVYLPPPAGSKPGTPYPEKSVKTGASDDKVYQILEGVKEGDKVVVTSTRLDQQRARKG